MLRIWLFCIIFAAGAFAFPQNKDAAFVVTSTEKPTSSENTEREGEKGDVPKPPKITEMNVFANVSNRFANTVITSRVKNFGKKAQEATFAVILPDSAYITGFIMEIDGKNYTAYIKEKEEAKKTYDQAVASGQGAAHVAVSARDSNRFTVSTNVEPESKATFYLTYEELLKRKQNYELVINIHPTQPVPNLKVEVLIKESKPLKFVKPAPIRSGNEIKDIDGDVDSHATVTNIDDKTARVTFNPSESRQKELAKTLGTKEDDGLSGQFVVQYDVERDSSGGEVLLKDGYFVHFFAPDNITPLPKHVVFVLDTSGSMYGQRIEQLKQAMKSILGELKNGQDLFNLVEFNSDVTVWNVNDPTNNVKFPKTSNIYDNSQEHSIEGVAFPDAYQADPDVTKKANDVVSKFNAEGGTNIYEALKVGLQLVKLQQAKNGEKRLQPLIIFLTDGEATVGESQPDKIMSKVSELNNHIPIFSLSFGDGADRAFLQKLSLRNDGFARHIYEAADASLQLQDFYKEISSPLLSNVTFKYTEKAKELTKTHFPNYFGGGEIIICGTIDGDFVQADIPSISAWGVEGPRDFLPKIEHPTEQMERVWAYLTIKQLLDEKETAKNKTENEKKALELALKYSFVTTLTSLVVVKPNETSKAVDTEAADKPVRPRKNSRPQYTKPAVTQYSDIFKYPADFDSSNYSGSASGALGTAHLLLVFFLLVGRTSTNEPWRNFAPLSAYPMAASSYSGNSGTQLNLRVASISAPVDIRFQAANDYTDSFDMDSVMVPSFISPSAPAPMPLIPLPERPLPETSLPFVPLQKVHATSTTFRTTTASASPFDSISASTTSTVNEASTEGVAISSKLEQLLKVLPWLSTIYNATEDSIALPDGNVKLGIDASVNEKTPCANAPNNGTGICTLIHNCEKIHNVLTSVNVYTQHYCAIEKYGGVCCPS